MLLLHLLLLLRWLWCSTTTTSTLRRSLLLQVRRLLASFGLVGLLVLQLHIDVRW